MTGKELKKRCEAVGRHEGRVNGSHHILVYKDYAYPISIPIHGKKDIPVGLLKSIMKQAGLK